MKDLKVAMVQMRSEIGAAPSNLGKMAGILRAAVAAKADVVCFPEASLTGYTTEDPSRFAFGLDDYPVREMIAMASSSGSAVSFGLIEAGPYITQVTVSGEDVSVYRKTHLGGRERKVFLQGDEIPVLRTGKAVIGVQLCWESHMPEVSTTLRNRGAELILNPHSSWVPTERRREVWLKYLPARAYDNGVYFCACNALHGGDSACGGAIVFDRMGDVVAEDFGGAESILLADLKAEPDPGAYPDKMSEAEYFLRRRPDIYDLH
ncbi:MAG: hypothetical protein KA502_01720 [Candidatus Methanomethylophilaceae archaeon]|nr:hypothetical protein [Candidatus Methanomethylophilaceae archaeon]